MEYNNMFKQRNFIDAIRYGFDVDLTNTKEVKRDLVCYILVRNLPKTMNPGKMAAQVHHAASLMQKEWADNLDLQEYLRDKGFGTTVVLQTKSPSADSVAEIKGLVRKARKAGLVAGKFIDPTYPIDHRLSMAVLTCGYVLVDRASEEDQEVLNMIQQNWELHD
jgi:peptidyl-tRNA hydrolase